MSGGRMIIAGIFRITVSSNNKLNGKTGSPNASSVHGWKGSNSQAVLNGGKAETVPRTIVDPAEEMASRKRINF
jgi:hypothetical protein